MAEKEKDMLKVDIKVPNEEKEEEEKEENDNIRIQRHEQLRLRLEKIIAQSTINGLSQAFSTRDKRYKLVWTLLFVVSILVFTYNFYSITVRYLNEPILTQLDPEYVPFTWPHITVCNPSNPIPFFLDHDLKSKWSRLIMNAEKNYSLPPFGYPNNQRIIWNQYIAMSSLDPRVFFAKGINGSFQRLMIDYKESTIASSSGDFDQYVSVESIEKVVYATFDSLRSPIPCYTLAAETLEQIAMFKGGLLSIKLYLLMDFNSHKIYNHGYESRKMYFYLTHPNATIETTTPKFIFPGTDSHLLIKESTHSRKKFCTTKTFKIRKFAIDLNTTQTFLGGFNDCRFHLSQSLFFRKCGCYNPYLPIYNLDDTFPRICTNMSLFDNETMNANIRCLNKVLEKTTSLQFESKLNETCGEYRKHKCTTTVYTVIRDTNAWSPLMSDARRNRLLQAVKRVFINAPENATEKFTTENLAIIKVDWNREPTAATYEEYEYPSSQFLSDIGGIAGLWLGLSVISVFEIIELLYIASKYVVKK